MKYRSEKSRELYELLLRRGYPAELCALIADQLNTDFTAQRMLVYLSHFFQPRSEDLADEMLSILNDRSLIAEKHSYFETNRAWNAYLNSEPEEE